MIDREIEGLWVKLRSLVQELGVAIRGARTINDQTADYGVLTSDQMVRFTGSHTCTLPEAIGAGHEVTIKNSGTGTVTVAPAGGDDIDGASSVSLASHDAVTLVDGGVNRWDIVSWVH